MCQDRVIKLLIFGFIAGLLLQECHAASTASTSLSKERRGGGGGGGADEEDYEYDDEDEQSRENAVSEDHGGNGTSTGTTQLVTKNSTIEAELDETVTLPCRVTNPEEKTIIMWHNTSSMIFLRDKSYSHDPRVSFDSDHFLTIRNVQTSDNSIYKCTLLPINKAVYITLKVKSPPYNVMITHGNKDYTNENLEIQQHDRKFIIHCHASGHPTPSITWSFRGKHLDNAHAKNSGIVIRKEFLEIHDVKAHHAGDYECLAQNGIGQPVSAVVTVHIKSSPAIVKHIEYLNTAVGENAELACLYHSNPEARKIQWFRGDDPIHTSAKYNIIQDRHNHHLRTRLTVRNVDQKDLVAYLCKIENNLGEASAKTILGLVPGVAHLANSSYSGGLLHTVWRVRSAQPLSDLQILYKGENTKYTTIDATISEQNKEESGDFWNIKRSIRLPEGEWFITARAKNTEGWSFTDTVPLQIQIPGEVSLDATGSSEAAGHSAGSHVSQSLSLAFAMVLFSSLLLRLF